MRMIKVRRYTQASRVRCHALIPSSLLSDNLVNGDPNTPNKLDSPKAVHITDFA